jgi:hypothetical protein
VQSIVQELLDIGALRRVAEFVTDHRGPAAALCRVEHPRSLGCVERERLLAHHVLARVERRDRKCGVRARRRDDAHRRQVVAGNELQRIGVNVRNACGGRRLAGLVARAAADRRDFPALRAKRGHVDLRAEAETDDADAAIRCGHVDP